MNVLIEQRDEKLRENQTSLLMCCRYLAANRGQDELVVKLAELVHFPLSSDKERTLESIVQAARSEGFQTAIYRKPAEVLNDLVPSLPVVVESRNKEYFVLTAIENSTDSLHPVITIVKPYGNEDNRCECITREQFEQL